MLHHATTNAILRIVLGLIFLTHGLDKFQSGIDQTAMWFNLLGLPGFLAYLVAWLEVLGGVALIVGLATRYTSAAFILLLVGALFSVKLSAGFLGDGSSVGYEFDLALLAIAIHLFNVGPATAYSVDLYLYKRNHES
ncbi:DoxX family protein [Alkalibacillus aidingensis]|uniref:DoxX family protein n=1 Tax=Alkalibacillus aidingensis TaxID=2747607 RepID=UPI001660BE3A|nr:DoxX family protein [Alkalibacillus aidingensis]